MLLPCILDDDGALDGAPVSGLNNADDGRILCDRVSIELPGEVFDLWHRLALTVDVDRVTQRPVLSHLGANYHGGGQQFHLNIREEVREESVKQ